MSRGPQSLFLTDIHRPKERQAGGITSFFVRRSVYFTFFFGKSTCINWDEGSDDPEPEPDREELERAQLEGEIQEQLERERLAQLEREGMEDEKRERSITRAGKAG